MTIKIAFYCSRQFLISGYSWRVLRFVVSKQPIGFTRR